MRALQTEKGKMVGVALTDIEISEVLYVDGGGCFQGVVRFQFDEQEQSFGQSIRARVNVVGPNDLPYREVENLLLAKAIEVMQFNSTSVRMAYPNFKSARADSFRTPV